MSKSANGGRARRERQSSAAPSDLSIKISFTEPELQFLVQALRDLPLKGTPDGLAQILPLVQGVRLKFASALKVAAGGAPQQEASAAPLPTEDLPPEEAPAAE